MKRLALASFLASAAWFCAGVSPAQAAADTPAVTTRASMQTMQIPSKGSMINALVYIAEGAGPHPVVVLLHGFPGNEKNLDLAQDMRRAGWDVVYFNYRGSWGSPGDFSFGHAIDDVASVVAYLRKPENAAALRIDPSKVVLVGHSMGGFMAVQGAAANPSIKAIAMISGADMAGHVAQLQAAGPKADALRKMGASLANEGMAPLAGCSPDGLAQELSDHVSTWTFTSQVGALKTRPTFVITSDDGLAPDDDAFAAALKQAGNTRVTTLHLPTDHSYSDQRVPLSQALLTWLATVR